MAPRGRRSAASLATSQIQPATLRAVEPYNPPKPGSVHGRALGTILDPKGKAIVNINKGEAFYGEVDILGKLYVTGYDAIKDASGKVIGIWYVGYEK